MGRGAGLTLPEPPSSPHAPYPGRHPHHYHHGVTCLTPADVHDWMADPRRLLAASMDDPSTHIGKLLAWARVYLNRRVGRGRRLAVSFCGPTALAHTIQAAATTIGSGVEFSADHQ